MYITRAIEGHIEAASRAFKVVLITGARQVGKTTLVRHVGERRSPPRTYVSLDEFGPRAAASEDPELFLQRFPPPVTVDEVQHAPDLLRSIKALVDRSDENGRIWLTGSQSFPLMTAVSESLAGRVAVVRLLGLSWSEERGGAAEGTPFRPDRAAGAAPPAALDLERTFARVVRGGYPRLAHPDAPDLEMFYGSYVQTYIERDVRALVDVVNLAGFRRFLRAAAARVGGLLNISDLARDAGVAVSTAREWLHALEATHQVLLLQPYFENIGKRQIKAPKLYFVDTGLACYLAGWRSARTAAAGAMAGALFENHVVIEIAKSWLHRGREAPIWYWRDKEKREVDLLLAEDGLLFPIEIKLTASPGAAERRGIEALRRAGARLGHGCVVCLVASAFPLSADVDALPVGAVL